MIGLLLFVALFVCLWRLTSWLTIPHPWNLVIALVSSLILLPVVGAVFNEALRVVALPFLNQPPLWPFLLMAGGVIGYAIGRGLKPKDIFTRTFH